MATIKTKNSPTPLLVHGRNATGRIIEGVIPAGAFPTEDPGLAIQRILAKHKDIIPTPVLPE